MTLFPNTEHSRSFSYLVIDSPDTIVLRATFTYFPSLFWRERRIWRGREEMRRELCLWIFLDERERERSGVFFWGGGEDVASEMRWYEKEWIG